MSDDNIRALAEKLKGLEVRLYMEQRYFAVKVVRQAAAALTTLAAENARLREALESAAEKCRRSDESQHSVKPLAELQPEVKHDPDA